VPELAGVAACKVSETTTAMGLCIERGFRKTKPCPFFFSRARRLGCLNSKQKSENKPTNELPLPLWTQNTWDVLETLPGMI
jgi:hypothetical protein